MALHTVTSGNPGVSLQGAVSVNQIRPEASIVCY